MIPKKRIPALPAFALAAVLAACGSKQEQGAPAAQSTAGGVTAEASATATTAGTATATATVTTPAAQAAQAASTQEASVSIGAGGVEAKAGDVSVKLPN